LATSDPIIYSVNSDYLDGKIGEGRVDALRALSTSLFPKLELAEIDYQVITGDDSIIDAGEIVHLTTILYNNPDWGVAFNPTISLNSISEYFEITNSNQDIDNINPGDVYLNIETPFEINVSESTPNGEYEFELAITANDTEYAIYESLHTLSLSINHNDELGDLNGDGGINISDIVIMIGLTLNNNYDENGDINGDGTINVQDIILIINIILNIE